MIRQRQLKLMAILFLAVMSLSMTTPMVDSATIEKPAENIIAETQDTPPAIEPEWYYPVSLRDLEIIKGVVAAESRGESYEGQMAVAQCVLTRLRLYEGQSVEEIIEGQFAEPLESEITDSVSDAVEAVFRDGVTIVDEDVEFFYAPARCRSSWHEQQVYVATIGNHKFFNRW